MRRIKPYGLDVTRYTARKGNFAVTSFHPDEMAVSEIIQACMRRPWTTDRHDAGAAERLRPLAPSRKVRKLMSTTNGTQDDPQNCAQGESLQVVERKVPSSKSLPVPTLSEQINTNRPRKTYKQTRQNHHCTEHAAQTCSASAPRRG